MGAACAFTLDGPDRDLTEEQFQENEVGIFFMTPSAWSNISIYLQSQCAKAKGCDINFLLERINHIEGQNK